MRKCSRVDEQRGELNGGKAGVKERGWPGFFFFFFPFTHVVCVPCVFPRAV